MAAETWRPEEARMAVSAEQFAQVIADRDLAGMSALVTADIDFKGLTPGRFWEAAAPDEVSDVVFGHWFEETDHIDAVLHVDDGRPTEDTQRMAYRFAISNPDGRFTVEQQAYYRTRGDRICYLRVLCSGYRPAPG
jgi:hypothetical protein